MSSNSLENIKQLISKFETEHTSILNKLISESDKVLEVCDKIDRSWSRSFAGYHGLLYFNDFQEPEIKELFNSEWGGIKGIPKGWNKKKPEEVKSKIEQLVGNKFSLDHFEDEAQKLTDNISVIHTEILILFSSFIFADNMDQEKELLSKIGNFEFDKGKESFINKMIPNQIITRDTKALFGGTCIPTHLYYRGVALSVNYTCNAARELIKLSNRLTRQIESKKRNIATNISEKNYWNLVNPFWLLWRLFRIIYHLMKLIWKHKIISLIIIFLSLLAIDYGLAWKNILSLWSLFHNLVK
jgi:hypothetical protein